MKSFIITAFKLKTMPSKTFSQIVLDWFDQYGRKDLPWQKPLTPYRVWVSEIMLQQTQVKTVIPYYKRFMELFPTIERLALADEDTVLHAWSGLGYYTRARMLLKAARLIVSNHQGRLPSTLLELTHLPGIGKSTAGAILAIAFKKRAAILDGNVKRLLSRYLGLTLPIDSPKALTLLWQAAEDLLPHKRLPQYTQAMMDLGATLCTRTKPKCENCPLAKRCKAKANDQVALIPQKSLKKSLPRKAVTFVMVQSNDSLLLCKRKENAVWKGLWSFPELEEKRSLKEIRDFCKKNYQMNFRQLSASHFIPLKPIKHTFTHYQLDIFPFLIKACTLNLNLMTTAELFWYNVKHPPTIGIPKPVATLMRSVL